MRLKKQLVKLNDFTPKEIKYFGRSYVKLTRLQHVQSERINIAGIKVRALDAYKYNIQPGLRTFTIKANKVYRELAISNKILRINLRANCLNLKVTNDLFTPRKNKNALMLSNDDLNKSIIKNKENGIQSPISTPNKSVSFNNTFYITPIPARHSIIPPQEKNSYENTFKEYLKKMNGSCSAPDQKPAETQQQEKNQENTSTITSNTTTTTTTTTNDIANTNENVEDEENEEDMEVEMLEDEPPRRGRGRPRGSGKLKTYTPPVPRDPNSPPKRRGWPLGLPRRKYVTYKNVHTPYGTAPQSPPKRGPGRPRKILSFGFQTIVTDIKSVNLPSELWSAHVSVTSKRAQVCFTRVVQDKSNNISVECDRSVKFNGTVKYLVRINNRDVRLLAAPVAVTSIRDIEILLDIVNNIGQNDPILEYLNR